MVLPGMCSFLVAGGRPSRTAIVAADVATGAGGQITIPATAQAGDLAVLVDTINSNAALVVPSGFTSVKQESFIGGANIRVGTSRKILTASDPGAVITATNAFTSRRRIVIFRAPFLITSVTASTWNGEGTDGDFTPQTVSVGSATEPFIVIGLVSSITGVASFSTETPAFVTQYDDTGSSPYLVTGVTVYNPSDTPANQDIDAGDLGNGQVMMSGYIEVS